MALIVLIPLLGYFLAWHRLTKSRSSTAALHGTSAILLALYASSLVDMLAPMSALLLICGSLLAIYEFANLIRQRALPPTSLGVLAFVSILFAIFHYDANFYLYDEFSHWGVFLKELLAEDALWGSDSNAMVLRYPPGAPVWQYFFIRYTEATEGNAYLAQFCLLMIPLLSLWEAVKWKQVIWLLSIFALIAFALSNFGHGFSSLYVDHLLGAWFAGTIFSFMSDMEDRSFSELLLYALPITTLVLIKDSGLFFAAAAIGIMALLLFWRIAFATGEKRIKHGLTKGGILTFVCVVGAGLITTTWNANRNAEGIPQSVFSTRGIITGITTGQSELDAAEQAELTKRYTEIVFHQQVSKDKKYTEFGEFNYELMWAFPDRFRLTTSSFILLFALWQIIVFYRLTAPRDRWRWLIVGTGLLGTAIVYVGILYLSYRFAFGERRMVVPSYLRYVHTAFLPMVLFVFLPLIPGFSKQKEKVIELPSSLKLTRSAVVFAAVFGAFLVFETPHLEPLYKKHVSPDLRQQMGPFVEKVRGMVEEDARVWIYLPVFDVDSLRRRIILYDLSPVRGEVVTDEEYLRGDPAVLQELIANWDYLWFPVKHAEADEMLKALVGEDLKEYVFRVDRRDGDIQVVALEGVFD